MDGLQIIGNASRSYVKVSPRVVEFYKALARNEAHWVAQPRFPDSVADFPDKEIVEAEQKTADLDEEILNLFKLLPGYTLSTTENPFEKCPEHVFSEKKLLPVICYHCNKEGHPAWACKLEKSLRINSCWNRHESGFHADAGLEVWSSLTIPASCPQIGDQRTFSCTVRNFAIDAMGIFTDHNDGSFNVVGY